MFSDSILEGIKERIELVDFISRYVDLKRTGSSFKGLCPFHQEKTPSFIVTPSKGIYKCFGCGVGGDIYGFVRDIENISFVESVKMLADETGVYLEMNKYQKKVLEEKKELKNVLELAADFYHRNLGSSHAGHALKYVESRFSTESIDKWQIGYASHEGLYYHLKGHFTDEAIQKAGLIRRRDNDPRGYFDFFRNRVMFPIKDKGGKIIAFSGRALEKEQAKYINSPESDVFIKSSVLYGLSDAKFAIRTEGYAIVVEGVTDVIANHENGIENCVGPCGTSFTEGQIRKLSKLTDRIVLANDPDAAGKMAAERVGKESLKIGVSLNIADLVKDDPDNFLRNQGKDGYLAIINNSQSVLHFAMENRSLESIVDVDDRFKKVRELYGIIDCSKSTLQKALWLQDIAKRLELDEKILVKDYSKYVLDQRKDRNEKTPEQLVLGFLAMNPLPRRHARKIIFSKDFSKPEYGYFFDYLTSSKKVDGAIVNPGLKLEIGTLFAQVENTNLFDDFKGWCDEKGFKVTDDQMSSLKGTVLNSVTNNSYVLRVMKKEVLANELRELERSMKFVGTVLHVDKDKLDYYRKLYKQYSETGNGHNGNSH